MWGSFWGGCVFGKAIKQKKLSLLLKTERFVGIFYGNIKSEIISTKNDIDKLELKRQDIHRMPENLTKTAACKRNLNSREGKTENDINSSTLLEAENKNGSSLKCDISSGDVEANMTTTGEIHTFRANKTSSIQIVETETEQLDTCSPDTGNKQLCRAIQTESPNLFPMSKNERDNISPSSDLFTKSVCETGRKCAPIIMKGLEEQWRNNHSVHGKNIEPTYACSSNGNVEAKITTTNDSRSYLAIKISSTKSVETETTKLAICSRDTGNSKLCGKIQTENLSNLFHRPKNIMDKLTPSSDLFTQIEFEMKELEEREWNKIILIGLEKMMLKGLEKGEWKTIHPVIGKDIEPKKSCSLSARSVSDYEKRMTAANECTSFNAKLYHNEKETSRTQFSKSHDERTIDNKRIYANHSYVGEKSDFAKLYTRPTSDANSFTDTFFVDTEDEKVEKVSIANVYSQLDTHRRTNELLHPGTENIKNDKDDTKCRIKSSSSEKVRNILKRSKTVSARPTKDHLPQFKDRKLKRGHSVCLDINSDIKSNLYQANTLNEMDADMRSMYIKELKGAYAEEERCILSQFTTLQHAFSYFDIIKDKQEVFSGKTSIFSFRSGFQFIQQHFKYFIQIPLLISIQKRSVSARITLLNEVPGRKARVVSLPYQLYCKSEIATFLLKYLHGIGITYTDLYSLHTLSRGANSLRYLNGNGLDNTYGNLVEFLFGSARIQNPIDLNRLDGIFYGEQSIHDDFDSVLDFKIEKDGIACHFLLQKYYEQMELQEQLNTKPRYRLIVVTAEVFENAMRQYQIENYKVTLSNYFPTNCRLFIGIPVYKDGLINRRDRKDRS